MEPGENIVTACRTCKDERKHVVVAAEGGVPLRVQCLTCGSNRKYRAPKPATSGTKKTTSRTAKKKAPAKTLDVSTLPAGEARAYAMDGQYEAGQILDHSKFGLGRIEEVWSDDGKMRVLFEDGERKLLCGKAS